MVLQIKIVSNPFLTDLLVKKRIHCTSVIITFPSTGKNKITIKNCNRCPKHVLLGAIF